MENEKLKTSEEDFKQKVNDMTEQELFDTSFLYENIVGEKNELCRIAKKNILVYKAKELKKSSQMVDTIKKLEMFEKKSNKEVERIKKENIEKSKRENREKEKLIDNFLPKSDKYDFSKYRFGEYQIRKDGMYVFNEKEGEYKRFSNQIVIPVEIYTGSLICKVKILCYDCNKNCWEEEIVPRNILITMVNIWKLSNYSSVNIDLGEYNNRKLCVSFFNWFLSNNSGTIKNFNVLSHIGWYNNSFLLYDDNEVVHNEGVFENYSKRAIDSLSECGDFETWLKLMKSLRQRKEFRVMMASIAVSPLLEKLGMPMFILNVWSSKSGNGKTLSCKCAMSMWGHPDGLTISSNNTQNFYMSYASFLNNIPVFADELQIIKHDKEINSDDLVMLLTSGVERGRLDSNSNMQKNKEWHNTFVFTNNDALAKEKSGEQVYNRVVDLEVNDVLFEGNPVKIADVIRCNYGFLGKKIIDYAKNNLKHFKELHAKEYNTLICKNISNKSAGVLACILSADKMLQELCFNDEIEDLTIEDLKEMELVKDKLKTNTSIKAYECVISDIVVNEKRFDNGKNFYGETWGGFKKEEDTVYIIKSKLEELLEKHGYEFNTVKKDWLRAGFLLRNRSSSKFVYSHQIRIANKQVNCVKLKLNIKDATEEFKENVRNNKMLGNIDTDLWQMIEPSEYEVEEEIVDDVD